MRFAEAFRSLPRPSSTLEPCHPSHGICHLSAACAPLHYDRVMLGPTEDHSEELHSFSFVMNECEL